ncbi:endonuclease Q family protein [Dissulfurimicrobium hydrothermale]|uniref:endonuclease Q family protein n=1 Tax=Dissulfurimicrobium hydrothermale TaxID=1750598 RepID=UPI001EDC907B|nr:endonuclease Q family protein [Dissulfurimicrobium hydrothermale]UKL13957.1 endonuclease Q family protein [Dissulfurimicrobium hydrothermale]
MTNYLRSQWRSKRTIFLADFHVHSRYSRATSKDMGPVAMNRAAKEKGLALVGTGDFTHPGYLAELKEQLIEGTPGIYVLKDDPEGTRFILTSEVSNIFTQGGKSRRVHTVIFAPGFEVAEDIQRRFSFLGNIASDGRPIFGFSAKDLVRIVKDASPDCLVLPAHVWTPWFSVFGAKSGFDSIEECFEEQSCHIHCLETGLSSDPPMNWRLSALDGYALLSNSDAHSPSRLGRESNVFSCPLTYKDIMLAIKDPRSGLEGTIEFFPEEGKYHLDGHRTCRVRFSPDESRAASGICPVCGGPLTLGVLYRVESLANRPEGFVPDSARPCVHLIPLEEIIADAFGVKSVTGFVRKEYRRLIQIGGTEMDILLWKEVEELKSFVPERILKGIMKMRRGDVHITPGYDGVYGRISLSLDDDDDDAIDQGGPSINERRCIQKDLF